MFLAFHHPAAQIAGAEIRKADPNHPVEIYYASAEYRDLLSMEESLGVTIYPEDKIQALPDPKLGIGSQITITRATTVNVVDGKTPAIYHTWATTVEQLFKEKNIELLGQDSVSPSLDTSLKNNINIKVTRVADVQTTENQSIDFQAITKNDNTLEKGTKKISQVGVIGEKAVTYNIHRVDGVETSKTIINTQTLKQPQNQITLVGTKIIVYGTGKATWYNRRQSMVAASNTLPKGTRVHVVSLASGKSVDVLIDDTGIETDAIIDLSSDAFAKLAPIGAGVIQVRVEKYYPND